eukprot:Cvel_15760.t1-p1 / transcript=Cvel_15760.t1 / gene=Cvel_15760 / organism=Chromera_velia_CCMP2878 / gene_product=hypothetical protein / transcript_product=hypothetical protein / location=Cvel_scaffold1180:45627-54452(+) / protein_length=643 / sequence_SO=supercontig / SO=protein_coding / is_pseudo=false
MRCDVRSSVCSRLSPRLHGGLCDSPRAFFGSTISISAHASHECMGREEATSGRNQREETAGCCPTSVLPTCVDGPRAAASRLVATQGVATASGGREEVGEAGLESSVRSRLCPNTDAYIGSTRLHGDLCVSPVACPGLSTVDSSVCSASSLKLTYRDVAQEADSGRRGQVYLEVQGPSGLRDVPETGASGDLGGAFVLGQEHGLSAAQREVPLDAEQEVDRDASPSQGSLKHLEEPSLARPKIGPQDGLCPDLPAAPRQASLVLSTVLMNVLSSASPPAGRCTRIKGSEMIDPRLPSLEAARELLCVTSSLSKKEPGSSRTPFPGLLGNVDWRSGGERKAEPASVNRSGSANRLDTGLSWSWSRGEPTGCVNEQHISRDADLRGWGLSSKARDRLAYVHSRNQGDVTEVLRGCEPKEWPRQRVPFGTDVAGGGRRDGGLTSRDLEQLGCGGMVGGCRGAGPFGRPGGGGTGRGHFGWGRGEAKPEGTLDSPQLVESPRGAHGRPEGGGPGRGLFRGGASYRRGVEPARGGLQARLWEGQLKCKGVRVSHQQEDDTLAVVGNPRGPMSHSPPEGGGPGRRHSEVAGGCWRGVKPAGHAQGLEQHLGGRDRCDANLASEFQNAHFCDGVRGGKPLKKDSDTGVAA